jgi:hypothetical protein
MNGTLSLFLWFNLAFAIFHRTITMADLNLEKLKSKMTTPLGSFSANEQSTFARL